ncbi:hypothetical protein [Kineosporia sp. R_H_3]|uniref:hypothetical protein n=1 Tax=Kineosporia sp. R_H_3 TaxID=1961848 RepID=UPI000B4B9567|nr:hypothetical protein [Kineosporia sp. R_H_3]
MKKILMVVVAAALLVVGAPSVAQAGGGSSSGWPTATAPLPAGTIVSQSSSKAVVMSPRTVSATLTSLDAAYVAKGWTVGAATGIPRWYKKSGQEVDVYFAALDGGKSYWTLNRR